MSNELMVYLKTTDNCQLNCEHCFTYGNNGKKGWFDVDKTVNFFQRLHKWNPNYDQGNIAFHGGEPMLAPIELMDTVHQEVAPLWPKLWWTVQTNLTYPLTDKKRDFFRRVCGSSFGTSWDKGIRWPDLNQELMWEHNVRKLTQEDGTELTVMVCLSSRALKLEPIYILDKMANLGIKHVNFERLTPNGNALEHKDLFVNNKEQDAWFLKMWLQSVEHKTYEYVDNMFMNSILTGLVYNTASGCRCRQCEQKVLTINADGTIGGCPNSAVENTFGTIDDEIEKLMSSEGRMCNISAESIRHPLCYTCEAFTTCRGDCHQLSWQSSTCAAPKSLMIHLQRNKDISLFKKHLNGFMGQE